MLVAWDAAYSAQLKHCEKGAGLPDASHRSPMRAYRVCSVLALIAGLSDHGSSFCAGMALLGGHRSFNHVQDRSTSSS